jgi:hypothetical protein
MIKDSRIVDYPVGAIKLHKFLGPAVQLLIDGTVCDTSRADIVFPTEANLKEAIGKLVRVALVNREDAFRFMLAVLDEYKSIT